MQTLTFTEGKMMHVENNFQELKLICCSVSGAIFSLNSGVTLLT